MTTARDFVSLAAKSAGILGVGQTLLEEDVNDIFVMLRRMLTGWQRKRWLVPALYDLSVIGNNQKSNKIGPGQYWNAKRPDKIQAAYIVQRNTGQTPVSIPCKIIKAFEDYSNIAVKELRSLPYIVFYDGAYPYGNIYFWPIPDSQYELHVIVKGDVTWQQRIATGSIYTAGSGYTDNTYFNVPLLGGDENQNGAQATITVTAGVVTNVEIFDPGQNYLVGNILYVDDATQLGGTGEGFSYLVTNTTINLDSQFDMDEVYEEAIHYNLAIRIGADYQVPVNDDVKRLAKNALNTVRMMNTQVPLLYMPPGITRGRAFDLYNPDGYGRF